MKFKNVNSQCLIYFPFFVFFFKVPLFISWHVFFFYMYDLFCMYTYLNKGIDCKLSEWKPVLRNWHNYLKIQFIDLYNSLGTEIFLTKVIKITIQPVYSSDNTQVLFENSKGVQWIRGLASVRRFTRDQIIPQNQTN